MCCVYFDAFQILCSVVCNDCNENAECIEGQCVCKENYTGNGTFCEQVAGKFKPQ